MDSQEKFLAISINSDNPEKDYSSQNNDTSQTSVNLTKYPECVRKSLEKMGVSLDSHIDEKKLGVLLQQYFTQINRNSST